MRRTDSFALVAMVGWGITYVPASWLLRDWSIAVAVGVRFALGGILLLVVLVLSKQKLVPGASIWVIIWIALTHTILFYTAVYWGIAHRGAGISALLSNTDPLFVALLAAIVLGERLSRRQWAGVVIGLTGAAVVVWDGPLWPPELSLDAVIVLCGAIIWSIGTVTVARWVRRDAEPLSVAVWQMLIGGLALCVIGFSVDGLPPVNSQTVGLVALTAVAGAAVPLALFYLALREAPAGEVSAWFFLVPVIGVLSAWAFLGETPAATLIVGFAAIAAGLWLVMGNRKGNGAGLVESVRSP